MFELFWEEFFTIEKVTARMVNNIAGISINDLSINVYLYFLAGVIGAAYVSYEIYKSNKVAWVNLGKVLMITVFLFWCLMEARISMNYFSYFQDDLNNLAGRSLEEKRIITSPPGLYEFTQLVKKHTRIGDKIAIINPPDEFIEIKLNYYLFPYNKVSTNEAQFIAGYFVMPGGYKYFANTQYGWIANKSENQNNKRMKQK